MTARKKCPLSMESPRQKGMVKALEDRLGIKVTVPYDCEYVGEIGAALLGLKRLETRADN